MTISAEPEGLPVTAVCASHPSRFAFLQRSILNFQRQTHQKKRLLIGVSDPVYARAVNEWVAAHAIDRTAPVNVAFVPVRTPTEIVSHVIAWYCDTEIVACWDDDDLSHPGRLLFQSLRLRTQPNVLGRSLYYFYDSDELFVTEYAQPAGPPSHRCAASSLMFRRNHRPLFRPGFGSWSAALLDGRWSQALQYDLIDDCPPHLFLVGHTGDNSRQSEFHRKQGSRLPATWTRQQLLQHEQHLAKHLTDSYCFPQSTLDVCGRDCQAFQVEDVPTWPHWLEQNLEPPTDPRRAIPHGEMQEQARSLAQANRLERSPKVSQSQAKS
jgi:hypothetical protein